MMDTTSSFPLNRRSGDLRAFRLQRKCLTFSQEFTDRNVRAV